MFLMESAPYYRHYCRSSYTINLIAEMISSTVNLAVTLDGEETGIELHKFSSKQVSQKDLDYHSHSFLY